jgi:hypothetical protein
MKKPIRRKYLPIAPKEKREEVDKLKSCWKDYKKHQHLSGDKKLTYKNFLEIRKVQRTNDGEISKEPKSYGQYAGHDHKQAWESLYSHVEDNEFNQDSNIQFDTETRYKVPEWALFSALNWRPKG